MRRFVAAAFVWFALAAPMARAQTPDSPAPGRPPAQVQTHDLTPPQPPQNCRLKQLGILPMTVARDSIAIPVTLNGLTKNLELNFTSGFNALTPETAAALGLTPKTPPKPRQDALYGDIHVSDRVNVADAQIGETPAMAQTFFIAPSKVYKSGAVGQLGTMMFERMEFDLDFAQGRLTLFNQDHCRGQVVYWTAPSNAVELALVPYGPMSTLMTLDDQKIIVRLGVRGPSLIGMNVLRGLFGLNPDSPGMTRVKPQDIGMPEWWAEDKAFYTYPFKSLSLGGITINHPVIYIYYEKANPPSCSPKTYREFYANFFVLSNLCSGDQALSLGLATLSKLHMFVSNSDHALYITPADAH